MYFICIPHRKVGEYTEPFGSLSRTVVSQTLIEKDELLIGNALDGIGHDLRMQLLQRGSFKHGQAPDL